MKVLRLRFRSRLRRSFGVAGPAGSKANGEIQGKLNLNEIEKTFFLGSLSLTRSEQLGRPYTRDCGSEAPRITKPAEEKKENINMKKLILIQSGSCWTFKAFIALGLTMACFALLPRVQAADGGLPNFNTAEGDNALSSLTTGAANTAVGWFSLLSTTDTNFNTATGAGSLLFNTANDNTAFGAAALLFNTTGGDNAAVGAAALENNVDGSDNNAIGSFALNANVSGTFNNAHGRNCLLNSTGDQNNAMGDDAMENNTTG